MKRLDAILWAVTIATFIIGDIATTHYAITQMGFAEGNYVPARAIEAIGPLALYLMKGVWLLIAFAVWKYIDQHTWLVPGVGALIGCIVVPYNLYIIVIA